MNVQKTETKGKIDGMFRRDCALLVVFLLAAAAITLFVLFQVLPLAESGSTTVLLTAVCGVFLLALAGAMLWVLRYLQKNRDEVYGEEIYYRELAAAGRSSGAGSCSETQSGKEEGRKQS